MKALGLGPMDVWVDVFLIIYTASVVAMVAAFLNPIASHSAISDISGKRARIISGSVLLSIATLLCAAGMRTISHPIVFTMAGATTLVTLGTAIWLWRSIISSTHLPARREINEDRESQKLLVREVDEARRKLRVLSDLSGDWIWQTDELGQFVYISDGIRKVLGIGPEAFLGKSVDELWWPDEKEHASQACSEWMKSGKSFRDHSYSCRTSRGTNCTIRVSGSPWYDENDTFRGYHGFASDATPQILLQDARAASKAKESFLASMSHEIRTPLNGVLGILELLETTGLTEDQKNLVKVASKSGDALLHLINEILDLSKISAGHFEINSEPAEVAEILQTCAGTFKPLASKSGTQVNLVLADTLPPAVLVDINRYRQVLVNLIGNAIKFTKNGTITIEAKWAQQDGDSGLLETQVIDTGIGIPGSALDTIFDEFAMVKDGVALNQNGTGLGLALCKKIVSLMGGDIGVKSSVGHGSTFWFSLKLPVTQMPSKPSMAQGADSSATAMPSQHILLVEDNQTNVLVTTRMLEEAGHTVTHAGDGAQAVQAFEKQRFDLILMDASMPVMDGATATKKIRKLEAARKAQPTPITALSAHAGHRERAKMISAGMDSCLSKPIKRDALLAELAKYIGRKSANVLPAIDRQPVNDVAKTVGKYQAKRSELVEQANNNGVAALKSLPVLDWMIVKELTEQTGAEKFPSLVEVFISEVTKRKEQLSHARDKNDIALLERTCHAIAGSSLTMGARRLSTICMKLETRCRENPDPKYLKLVDTVSSEIDATIAELRAA